MSTIALAELRETVRKIDCALIVSSVRNNAVAGVTAITGDACYRVAYTSVYDTVSITRSIYRTITSMLYDKNITTGTQCWKIQTTIILTFA